MIERCEAVSVAFRGGRVVIEDQLAGGVEDAEHPRSRPRSRSLDEYLGKTG